jgi:hypothetical protein
MRMNYGQNYSHEFMIFLVWSSNLTKLQFDPKKYDKFQIGL